VVLHGGAEHPLATRGEVCDQSCVTRRLALLLAISALPGSRSAPADTSPLDMARVPAGPFTMGSEKGDPDERPVRTVQLVAYAIDRHEVTQAQYARCVQAGACRRARQYPDNIGPSLPVVGVSWDDAGRYCRWAGKRLPTEAEWERAARGQDARSYPWGAGLSCAKANFGSFLGDGPCGGINPGRVLPVGSRPAGVSPVGAHDMAGNVWEWVANRYGPYVATAEDRRLPGQVASTRVVRGGSCCSYFAMPTTTNRLSFPADYVDSDIGFRCAR
jgi:eukaryotic-like serine/threonine-protein kinase